MIKTKEKSLRQDAKRLLAIALAFVLILGLLVPSVSQQSYAASKTVRCNVATSHVTGNYSKTNLPSAAKTLYAGSSYYFNMQTVKAWKATEAKLYVKAPGGKYSCVGTEKAKNYFTYAYLSYKFSKAGTYQYYWSVKCKDDKKTYKSGTYTLTVKAKPVDPYPESKVKVTKNGQVVDTFNGVAAKYITGINNSNTGTYCCAQYVKNYYSKNYKVTVNNLLTGKTPKANKGKFKTTNSPKAGDIVYHTNSGGSGHWMILKSVNSDGTYTVIEQNCKFKSGSSTYTYKNRHISSSGKNGSHKVSNLKFFTYVK